MTLVDFPKNLVKLFHSLVELLVRLPVLDHFRAEEVEENAPTRLLNVELQFICRTPVDLHAFLEAGQEHRLRPLNCSGDPVPINPCATKSPCQ